MIRISKSNLSIYLVVFFFCILSSCNQEVPCDDVKKLMGDWYKKELSFNDLKKISIYNKLDTLSFDLHNRNLEEKYYMVHYFDANCDQCIKELEKIQKFMESHSMYKNLEYIFIANAVSEVYLVEAMEELDIKFPIYFDEEYKGYKQKNGFPLEENIFNTLLINHKAEILLFGAPFDNATAEIFYLQVINGCNEKY